MEQRKEDPDNPKQPLDMADLQAEFAFEQQQNQLAQLRDMLQKNQQTLSTTQKEKENYAATLSRIRMQRRGKGTPKKREEEGEGSFTSRTPDVSKSPESSLTPETGKLQDKSTTPGRVRVNLLQQQVEQTRQIMQQRESLTKEAKQRVEGIAEQLKVQLPELDTPVKISDLQAFSPQQPVIDPSSDTTREMYAQILYKDNKIIELNNRILELERNIMDYQENLREKDSVLDAKARSITLITDDMSKKNKVTVDALEETRQEMREMQNQFIEVETKLKTENQDLSSNLASKEQRLAKLESLRFDLNTRNAELQQKIVALQSRSHEVLSQGLPADKDRIAELERQVQQLEINGSVEDKAQISELTQKLEDASKQVTKTKTQYGKRIKSLEKQLAALKKNESAVLDLQELQNRIAELEEEKGNLQLSLVDFDEMKASDAHLKARVAELEERVNQQNSDLDAHIHTLAQVEADKLQYLHSLKELQASEGELQAELEAARSALQEHENAKVEAEMRSVELESRSSDLKSMCSDLETQVSSLQYELEALRPLKIQEDSNISEMQASLELKSSEIATLVQQLEVERSAKAELENSLLLTNSKLITIESCNTEIEKTSEHSKLSLQQEISVLQEHFNQSQQERENMVHQISILQEELRTNSEFFSEQIRLSKEKEVQLLTECKSFQDQLQANEEELVSLRIRVEMQSALEEEAERWKSELMQRSDEVENLTQQLNQSSNQLTSLSQDAGKIQELECKITELSCSLKEVESLKVEQAEMMHRSQQAVTLKLTEHEAEVEALQLEIQKKEQRSCDLEEQLAATIESKQQIESQCETISFELNELRQIRDESDSIVQQLTQRLKTMEEQVRIQFEESGNLSDQVSQLQEELKLRDDSYTMVQNTLREVQHDLDRKNSALAGAGEAEQKVDSLQAELVQVQRKLQDEVAALRQRAEQAEDELAAAFSQADHFTKEHKSAQENWNQERNTLQTQILEFQEIRDTLDETISNLQDNISSVQVQLGVAIGEKEAADAELNNIKDKLFEFNSIKEQNDYYNRQITELQMELSSEQQSNVTTVQALRDENNNLKSQLQQSNNFVSQLQSQLTTEQQNITSQIQGLQEENRLLNSTKEELSALYTELHKNYFDLQQQKDNELTNLIREHKTISEELSKCKNEISEYKSLLSNSEAALDKSKIQISSLTSDVEKLQSRVQELVSVKEDVNLKRVEMSNLEGMLHVTKDENEKLKAQLEQRQNVHSEILSSNSELQATLNEREKLSKENLNHLNSELESYKNQIKRFEVTISEYIKQIENYEMEKIKSCEYVQSLSNDLLESRNYVQLLQATSTDLQNRLQAMQRAEVEQAENYMALTTQVKETEEANTSLQEEIHGLHRIMEEHPVWQESGDEARELRHELQAVHQDRLRLLAEIDILRTPKIKVLDADLQSEVDALNAELSVLRRELESAREELIRREHDAVVAGWDEPESWGDAGLEEQQHLQQQQAALQHQAPAADQLLVAALQAQLSEAETAQARLHEELRASQVRCGKLIKQVKNLKEQTTKKQSSSSDLDKVLEEEMQSRLVELQKELSELQAEKTSILARADTLVAANERLVDMKEQQDSELERSRAERAVLVQQLSALQQWQPDDEASAQKISLLESQLRQAREKCVELEEALEHKQQMIDEVDTQVISSEVKVSDSNTSTAPIEEIAKVAETNVMTSETSAITAETVTKAEIGINTEPAQEAIQVSESGEDQITMLRQQLDTKVREMKAREEEHHSLAAYIAQLRGALEAKSVELAALENHPKEDELKSELDSALYMLHQRDVRCEELTIEVMALMEERDTLQLRLSSALRMNEQQRVAVLPEPPTTADTPVVSQEQELNSKLSELRSVGHTRDVTLQREREARHSEHQQMMMPPPTGTASRPASPSGQPILESDHTLMRDTQSTSTTLFNWLWGQR